MPSKARDKINIGPPSTYALQITAPRPGSMVVGTQGTADTSLACVREHGMIQHNHVNKPGKDPGEVVGWMGGKIQDDTIGWVQLVQITRAGSSPRCRNTHPYAAEGSVRPVVVWSGGDGLEVGTGRWVYIRLRGRTRGL